MRRRCGRRAADAAGSLARPIERARSHGRAGRAASPRRARGGSCAMSARRAVNSATSPQASARTSRPTVRCPSPRSQATSSAQFVVGAIGGDGDERLLAAVAGDALGAAQSSRPSRGETGDVRAWSRRPSRRAAPPAVRALGEPLAHAGIALEALEQPPQRGFRQASTSRLPISASTAARSPISASAAATGAPTPRAACDGASARPRRRRRRNRRDRRRAAAANARAARARLRIRRGERQHDDGAAPRGRWRRPRPERGGRAARDRRARGSARSRRRRASPAASSQWR